MELFDVEEGSIDFYKDVLEFFINVLKIISKGFVEEEVVLQEVIRKSFEDLIDGKISNLFYELENFGYICRRLFQREGCSFEFSL